jgi:diaminohydroxyphosphoribosylaminopyrimidine deaminase / 5-amino-6-(5-phosphoribosylamino)uracil reductase
MGLRQTVTPHIRSGMSAKNDERFMRVALNEARRAIGMTSPNPAVGAVLVIDDKVVARGHHRKAGEPHAEVECLSAHKKKIPSNGTLYVTLEPCSTTGRTGPCVDEIIKSRVKNVVIGVSDVNPRHAGRGISILQDAGIKVRLGVLAEECTVLNEAFNKWIVTGKPFVIAKCGMSLDGRLTRPPAESPWITSAAARRHAHGLRAEVDAILVGAETVRIDNPRLTVRGTRGRKQPLRVILSRSGSLPKHAKVFTDRFAKQTRVYRNQALDAVLRDLGQKKITSVLIEGGGEILGQALDSRLIDKLQIYIGPLFTGGPVLAFPGRGAVASQEAARLARATYGKIDHNICVTGYPIYPSRAHVE